jgi:hypothetical protein
VSIKGVEGVNEWKMSVVFDAERAGTSFREWIDQLTPVRYSGPPKFLVIDNEQGKELIL